MINADVPNHGNVQYNAFPWTFCQTECLRYGGYIYVKCDSRHFCPTNSLPIAIWSIFFPGGVFHVFFINYTDPHLPQKRIIQAPDFKTAST